MQEKVLSIFVDESGDFGPYEIHAPYYLVVMVLHDQNINLDNDFRHYERYIQNLGFDLHAVHVAPLIRRESIYKNELRENRKRLFNTLFNLTRKLNIKYACVKVRKAECSSQITLIQKISKEISSILQSHQNIFKQFDRIIVYYDNGQIELTKILTSVFSTSYVHVEFRTEKPINYKLFQVADLLCTIELLNLKAESNSFSRSELDFFGNIREFKKSYLKHIRKKLL